MLKIRMQRTGRINQPSYRIIVTEHARAAKTGAFVEELGTYNPATKARTLKEDRVKYWISVGAQPSGTMHNMLVSTGVIKGKKINVLPKKTVAKKEGEEVTAAPATAAPDAEAAPAEAPQA
jgi:small subunit ribosomal protein S16